MIAIVTGASSGIGMEFVKALDRKGLDEIWLLARRADRLESVAGSTSTPCRIVPIDLTVMDQRDSFFQMLDGESPEIGWLINCAGMGRFGSMDVVPLDSLRNTMNLNMNALVEISWACIPYMKAGSHIIQVCSASAYIPLEGLNVYSSSKTFVHSFSEVLREDLREKGISVTEVSPGWVGTDFISLSQDDHTVPSGVFKHTVTAEAVVTEAMHDVDHGKDISICGTYNKFQVFMCKHFPSLARYVWKRSLR